MWGRFRVGLLIVIGTGIAQTSTVSLAGPGVDPGAAPRPGASTAPGAPALRALDKPAFTATPDELLAIGKAAPTGDWSEVILRDQRDVSYDEQGRATARTRRVYVVQVSDDSGASDDDDSANTMHAVWHPSYQDRPVIRARVIAPAGTAVDLDPAGVTESSPGPRAASSDSRYLTAPLPAVEAGSVVEQEIVVRDREPQPAGSVDTWQIGDAAPTSSTVITYAAPASLRLHHIERQLPAGARVRHQVTGGRETWSYELAALPPQVGRDPDAPDDVLAFPYVGASTGASWEAVARAYRKRLDERIAAGPVDWPAELPRAASAQAVDAITAWVHHHVRRSGDGLDDELGVPRSPAETVTQAAGNGSDKAMLLVALLRQAGIRADVALIATGWGHLVDPDLPGVTAFDHAIVRARVGARELWIDPGEALARPGQLPERDQGRRALVIADDTRALAVTPQAASTDNTIRDVRTFVAAEQGWSKLTRVVRTTGAFEIEHRNQARVSRPDLLKRTFADPSEREFGGTLDRVASSGPEDLAAPFEMTFEVKDARRVSTELAQIDIYLYPQAALEELPWLVTSKHDSKPRTHDFVWGRPHIHEVENRIVVPPGFTLPAPVAEQVRPLGGTATFTTHQEIDGQTLIVRFRLDTGKPRLTPAELAAVQTAVQGLADETVHFRLDYTALALVDAGKPRDALAEGQRMIALHPAEAVHHTQLALVLERVGAGEAARREARKAVAMAPHDVDVLTGLGWILTFDTVGRQYTYDWDRAGAIAVLRQARKLDPKYLGAVVTLAGVLERDAAGRVFNGADLAGAAEALRAALAIENSDENTLGLARVLLWSEQFAEAEKVARGAGAGDDRDRLIVAAVAGRGGAAPAIRVAGELRSGAARNPLLSVAGWIMAMLQHYDVARELLSTSGAIARADTGIAGVIAKLQRLPPIPPAPADPRSAVRELLLAQLDPLRKPPVFWDAAVERELRRDRIPAAIAAMRNGVIGHWLGDLVQTLSIEVEGDAGVWRATLDDGGKPQHFYLAVERGAVKLLGDSTSPAGIGRYILRGDARADGRARRLLDWFRADIDPASAPEWSSFKSLWGQGVPTSHDAIQLAAAVLAGDSDPDRVLPVATRCASTLPDAELECHELRLTAYRVRRRWPEAVAESEAILALRPGWSDRRAPLHAYVLAHAGRFDDADRLLDAMLAKDPGHRGAKLVRFEVAAMRLPAGGAAADVIARGEALVQDPGAGPSEFNQVAWQRLAMVGMPGAAGDLTGALELARKAVDKLPQNGAYLNTLATLEAEHGDLDRAIPDNLKAMELRHITEPTAYDWYVIGRIEEQLGLTADAVVAYKRVTGPPSDSVVTAQALAQRRLAAITRP
jgi:tetratricopeptide (TPR) repeat protein